MYAPRNSRPQEDNEELWIKTIQWAYVPNWSRRIQSSGKDISGGKGELHALDSMIDGLDKPEDKGEGSSFFYQKEKNKAIASEKEKNLCKKLKLWF